MLTYCTNIHPGESWGEIFGNLRRWVPEVKRGASPDEPFPLGLWLPNLAASEIDERASAEFMEWCAREGCFVAAVNGFPYGAFHGREVKERVYLPDWRSPERLAYTLRLAGLLARWLPEGGRGSISSVPFGWRDFLSPGDMPLMRRNLAAALERLERIRGESGRTIILSLEPEPGCLLETVADVARIFGELDLPGSPRAHLGVCYDCCHQALQFEEPAASLDLLAGNGIAIGHVQVSSALALEGEGLEVLAGFDEPCYLHQTVGRRRDGTLVRFRDLPDALRADQTGIESWRVHFHVPVFIERHERGLTTRPFLEDILPRLDPGLTLEVETYTWSVLPPELRTPTVAESIVRELEWVRGEISGR